MLTRIDSWNRIGTRASCKGALVKVNRAAYSSSIEAGASDPQAPAYIFEGPGELLVVKGEYGQVRWNRPVPDVWLRMDQLEACS